jgi:hypothetical protein
LPKEVYTNELDRKIKRVRDSCEISLRFTVNHLQVYIGNKVGRHLERKMLATPSVFDLDTYLLREDIAWSEAKKLLRVGGEGAHTAVSKLTVTNHLIYIRALSRVLVDVHQHIWNQNKVPEDRIHVLAAGSVTITSDYDVTLVGKQASDLCRAISTVFERDTGKSLAGYADTNLYASPLVRLTPTQQADEDFVRHFKHIGLHDIYLPFPQLTYFEQRDRQMALNRYHEFNPPTHSDDYMYSINRRIEDCIYTDTWQSLFQSHCYRSSRFVDDIHALLQLQPDAYWTISSVAVVVVEMQSNQPNIGLTKNAYITTAIENLACVNEHRGAGDDIVTSIKYVYRVLYSWMNGGYHYLEDEMLEKAQLEMVQSLNATRGDVNFDSSPNYKRYQDGIYPSFIEHGVRFMSSLRTKEDAGV